MMSGPDGSALKNICLIIILIVLTIATAAFSANFEREPGYEYPVTDGPYAPRPFTPEHYVVYRTVDEMTVDGVLDERSWINAPRTVRFGHILMEGYKKPFLATHAQMLWDDTYFYAAAVLEEPNLMGHVVENDMEIYDDNDIELFIDIDSDSQNYIELEFNCLGTVWDMLLPKEYNRGGIPFSHPNIEASEPWDLEGMLVAVRVDGSLNYPLDTDTGWTIEIAIPWRSLQETSASSRPLNSEGTSFRINYSRVQYPWSRDVWPVMDWEDRGGPCWDWTWSPNLVYNLHSCESWGRVTLSGRTVLQPTDETLETKYKCVPAPAPEHAPEPGDMVKIDGGTYSVGPDRTDPASSPEGTVTVDDFHIDRYEVTIAEFTRFLNDAGNAEYYHADMRNPDLCGIAEQADGSFTVIQGRELYPVVFVTYDAAEAYAAWAGKRLPTEYEWEIAARNGDGRLFPWGEETPSAERANYDYMVGHTTPVGSYEQGRTRDGVYDMAGNVWEYVEGRWHAYPWSGVDEDTPASGQLIRGGSWMTAGGNIATTYRNGAKSGVCAMVGFRCARDGD